MKHLTLTLLAMLAWGAPAAGKSKPNVLFISVDDLRCELGCYGVTDVRSPNLDTLAKSSTTFLRAYVQQSVCNPSRVSIMTGMRPDSTRVWDLATEFRTTIPDAVTLPQHFRQHGYYAVSYGKIFHNPWPDNISWDEPHHWPKQAQLWSEDAKQRLKRHRAEMRAAGKSEAAIRRIRGPATESVDLQDSEHVDGAIADQAIAAMRRLAANDQPFFLAAGFIRPHLPFVVPRKYWEMYERDRIPLAKNPFFPRAMPPVAFGRGPRGGFYELADYMDFAAAPSPFDASLSESQQRELKHGYYASVSFIDAQIGRLLAELKRLKLEQETLVVVWSDHGWKLGEHNGWCKQTNYEIDTRAPLMIRVPGATGQSCSSLVEFVDIYPTLCELAGLPIPKFAEGTSLKPLLKDPAAKVKDAAFSQFPRNHAGRKHMGYAVRTEHFRYIEWVDRATGETTARELYDHRTDPDENTNVAGDAEHAETVGQHSTRLWRGFQRPSAARQSNADREATDRPNVLILMADDWSWPHAGSYRDPVVKTPTFDRIAREGVLFTNAHVGSPSCTPSRMAFATGQWHWRLKEAANLGGSLAQGTPVYAELLQQAGYEIGFARKGAGPSPHKYTRRDPFGPRFKNFKEFLDQRSANRPFCFWYGAGEPHRPYRFGEAKAAGIDSGTVRLPSCLPDNATTRQDFADYLHRVQRFDQYCAQAISLLEKSGELKNTIVVVAGDNGLPFPRCKATLYDTGTHVPLAIRWGDRIKQNQTVDAPVSLIDIAPTLLEAAGVPIPDTMTGKSMLTNLFAASPQQSGNWRDNVLLGMERHVYAHPCRALRTKDYLYIRNFGPDQWKTGDVEGQPAIDFKDGTWPAHEGAFSFNIDPSPTKSFLLAHRDDAQVKRFFELACGCRPTEELYVLKSDPAELNNVAGSPKYAQVLEELRTRLAEELKASGDPRFAP